jgi:NAD(P)-dependent dehydrogenase (short-subunit alcohol dehydrogenase family)
VPHAGFRDERPGTEQEAEPMMDPTPAAEHSLTGQVALVTGGGRGIGRAIAHALAAAGAAVAVVARSADQLAETVASIVASGSRARAFPADVTDRAAVTEVVCAVERDLGPVDLLVNNAGLGGPAGPTWEADPDEWWRCVEVNLRGPLLCCRLVVPGMVARRRGRVINVASGAGTRPIPFLSAYSAGKAALIRLTENLAAEAAEHGVRVFAMQPGTVRTAMAETALRDGRARRWLPWFVETFEQGRDVPPERAARLALFLASGRADALSGRYFDVAEDAEEVVRRAAEVRDRELYALRMDRLAL